MQVKAAIKRGSNAKRTIAAFFFALSAVFIRARRVKNGVDLKWAVQPRPLPALLSAVLTVALLAPFHRFWTTSPCTNFSLHRMCLSSRCLQASKNILAMHQAMIGCAKI